MPIDEGRFRQFGVLVSDGLRSSDTESMTKGHVVEVANREMRPHVNDQEADAMLRRMEAENKIMYRGGTVHMI